MNELHPNALLIPVGENWVSALFTANRLVRGGYRVLWITRTLTNDTDSPADMAGSFIVPLEPGADPGLGSPVAAETVTDILAESGLMALPIDGAAGVVAAPVGQIRIGLYGGGGAPMNQAAILAACGFPVRFLTDAEVRAGGLAEFDVFIMPGGGTRAMNGQIEPLGEEGARAIADFVRAGGMYIGCCAGTYDCIVNSESFLASCPAQAHLQLLNAMPWQGDSAIEMFGGIQSPGVGVIEARNERPDHPVMLGMPPTFPLVHYNGPILDPIVGSRLPGASAAVGLASFAGTTERFTPAEAFAGPPPPDERTDVSMGIAAGRSAAAAGELGTGRVVAFGSHPELGADPALAEWFDTARMLANAVLWQAVSRLGREPVADGKRQAGPIAWPLGSGFGEAARLSRQLADRAETLQRQPLEPRPMWLAPEYAMSTFGLAPDEIWRQSLVEIIRLAGRAGRQSATLAARMEQLMQPPLGPVPDVVRQAAIAAEHRLLYNRAEAWDQDGGYQGVLALLQTAIKMCDQAMVNWEMQLGPPAGPYAYLDTNPYHLVAGSYLAAVGVIGAVVQLLDQTESELAMAELLGRDLSREPIRELETAGV